ncbi:hypothetical protein PIB30_039874 [Stylosanthes scabra]|uniref:Uncharacterized protein n=1 Tax=Stylosanthes scabra TaxID=79078 RepID=A0ABU6VFJ9_9FABA|nr:hypothetical protein [Stylosanthes scabra]
MNSVCSSDDDASSSSNGPLYKLSELMNHLPIRRGLSMFYQGKAQSFTCLERVQSIEIENLAKKGSLRSGYRKTKRIMMKSSSSSYIRPKATISKKLPPSRRGSSFASLVTNKKIGSSSSTASHLGPSTLSISVHNHF